jgi:hypothetical protein
VLKQLEALLSSTQLDSSVLHAQMQSNIIQIYADITDYIKRFELLRVLDIIMAHLLNVVDNMLGNLKVYANRCVKRPCGPSAWVGCLK